MNKSILINVGWIAMAGVTFAVGRMTAGSGETVVAVNESGRSQKGLTSIIEMSPNDSKKAAVDADGDFLSKYLEGESGVLSKEGMAKAMREAMAENDPVKRALMMAQLMQNLDPDNIQEALKVLRESPDRRENFQYLALLQYAWGKIDGEAAIAAAIEEGGRGGSFGAMSVLSGWATTDPEAAKAWIASQEDGREKMMYTAGLVEGLAKVDPAAATAYVLSMAEQEGDGGFDVRARYMSNIASEMLKQGVDVAAAWANGLPEGSMRASALSEVAASYARQDSAAAARWIEEYAGSADASRAVEQIADRWARENPADAAAWVAGLPEASQADAMRSVFSEWAGNEPVAASEYLAALEPSAGRDSAVSGFARELAGTDASSAIEWATSIADEQLRERTELSVARQWYREEPEAAQAWAAQNLSEESQQAITQRERGDFGGGRGGDPGGRGGFGGGGGPGGGRGR